MQININNGKSNFINFLSNKFQKNVINSTSTNRLVAVLVITALLLPVFYFADWQKAAAQSLKSLDSSLSVAQTTTPFAAPPEVFNYSTSSGIQAQTFGAFTSLAAVAANVSAPAVNFFTAPAPPLGFETVKTASPAAVMLSSATMRIGSFFGLFSSTSVKDETKLTEVNNKETEKSLAENPKSEAATATAPFNQPTGSVWFDFDGDTKADIARFNPATKEWKVLKSSDSSQYTITTSAGGATSPVSTPGDFDGDGKTDFVVFNAGNWTGNLSSSINFTSSVQFGQAGDKPAVGDYNGDGKADIAVFRPSNGTWYISNHFTNSLQSSTAFGAAGDVPVVGNYDGDTQADIAVWRPSTGYWFIQGSTAGFSSAQWGASSDVPVPADYDGDGKTDKAVYRGSGGIWYIIRSSDSVVINPAWGNYGDQPVPADYDDDNKADLGVWRPSTGVWHIYKSTGSYYSYGLGSAGDMAVPSAYIRQIGSEIHSYDFARTLLSPKNATGGTDLYSRNFSWGASLVNLPGRAGLNAGLGIGYNSLVWTKHDNTMYFDADSSNVSPGFRIGFPTIEATYYDSASMAFNFLMVTPSGARVEFRQKANAADGYETTDSSYALLKHNPLSSPNTAPVDLPLTVTTTDGMQMFYSWIAGAYRCTEIKDRNGNKITIVNNAQFGFLETMTDTLGRVVKVNYDSENYPTSITTQDWKTNNGAGSTETHVYAAFYYANKMVSPNFTSSMGVYGPSGLNVKALETIYYTDSSSTKFDYNAYGQVYKVSNYAPDGTTLLNHVRTNLESPATTESDCPRFTETKSWVKNFNLSISGVEQETLVTNTIPTAGTFTVTGQSISEPASVIQVSLAGHPNNLTTKTYVGSSGWKEGLPLATEDWEGSNRQRWTWTNWTQDNTSLGYILNPRVTETKVGDTTNIKRTEIKYHMYQNNGQDTSVAKYGLVKEMLVYDSNQSTVWKKVVNEYKTDNEYISRRLVGLPFTSESWGWDGTALKRTSKVKYDYDQGDFADNNLVQSIAPEHHDTDTYGASFTKGRGNVTTITSYEMPSETSSVETKMKYNTAGSVVAQITPDTAIGLTRDVKISYADSFNDNVNNRNTYAYPTAMTDPAGNSSVIKYRFDMGANVWAKSPTPTGNANGKATERIFDVAGRLQKQSVWKDNQSNILAEYAYTRYVYFSSAVKSQIFTTINDGNNNGPDAADEAMTESWTDGAGRVKRTRTPHPGTNTSGWSATRTNYDILGRVVSQTVPTEVTVSGDVWTPVGTELSTSQQYDWKGRVTKTTNTDGTFSTATYDGCGCAGGEEVTIEGEETAPNEKRKQKIYSDILGRQYKTEIYNYSNVANGSVYSSTVTKFNERDQAEWVKQFDGAAPSDALTSDSCPVQGANDPQTCQITKMTYDGFGRIESQHKPQQDASAATEYEYYQTGEVKKVTDARGATSTYTYNNRGLVTGISYAMGTETQSGQALGNSLTSGSPIGALDSIDGTTWKVKGWSLDPDNSSASNTVHIYIDGPAGTGTHIGTVTANLSRPDVNSYYSVQGNHGYEYTIPNQYLDGNQHTIYAHGIDTGGDAPKLLDGSPKSFTYSPNSIQPPLNASIGFEYDSAGNRQKMTDNLGEVNYEYDGLSRLKAETRKFVDTTPNNSALVMADAPLPNNSFKLQYSYGLANQLKSLTDPFGATINYGYDGAGRLTGVTGSSFGGVTNYASGAEYQAWGALKKLSYAEGLLMTMTYNDRLQADTYSLGTNGQVMNKEYDYYADGSLRYVKDVLDGKFDRLNIYDNVGRIKAGKTGLEARGTEITDPATQKTSLPYRQDYAFNAFNNMTVRENRHWGIDSWQGQSNDLYYQYKNNRVQGLGWQYDADGRNLQTSAPDDYATSRYNAAGQMVRSTTGQTDAVRWYDGNGREVKRVTGNSSENSNGQINWQIKTKYYVRSSVLGNEVLSEVWANGKKAKTFVRAAGAQIAYQSAYASESAASASEAVIFEYSDASGMSQRTADKTGAAVATGDGGDGSPVELDPLGNNVGTYSPYVEQPIIVYEPEPLFPMLQPSFDDSPTYVDGQRQTCELDGFAISCSRARDMMEAGSAIPASIARYQHLTGFRFENRGLGIFTTYIPGHYFSTPNGTDDDDTIRVGSQGYQPPRWETHYLPISWNLRQNTEPVELVEPLAPPKTNIENLKTALNTCLKTLFAVSLTSFNPSEKGKNGSVNVNFTDPKRRLNGFTGFGVVNDVVTYSRRAMVAKVNAVRKAIGEPPLEKNSILYGYTDPVSPDINFTVNNENEVNTLKTQIHELGHSLEYIARPAIMGFTKYKEAGWELENCVVREGGFKP